MISNFIFIAQLTLNCSYVHLLRNFWTTDLKAFNLWNSLNKNFIIWPQIADLIKCFFNIHGFSYIYLLSLRCPPTVNF